MSTNRYNRCIVILSNVSFSWSSVATQPTVVVMISGICERVMGSFCYLSTGFRFKGVAQSIVRIWEHKACVLYILFQSDVTEIPGGSKGQNMFEKGCGAAPLVSDVVAAGGSFRYQQLPLLPL